MTTKEDPLDLRMTSGPPPLMVRNIFHKYESYMKSAEGLKMGTLSLIRNVIIEALSIGPGGSL